jgi:hypothetical protein
MKKCFCKSSNELCSSVCTCSKTKCKNSLWYISHIPYKISTCCHMLSHVVTCRVTKY